MADFYPLSAGPHYCPSCLAQYYRLRDGKRGRRYGVELVCVDQNYSGCGVDIASCPKCGKGFQISYKVDKIERAPDQDVDLKAVKEERIQSIKKVIEATKRKADEDVTRWTKELERLEAES